ncbi:MAG: bifunctional oligoribonuclease/PAP phosphatase NrnA [Candidatus Omnitrophota bacterium]
MKSKWFDVNLKEIAQLIKDSRTIIVACHMNPDGDAIGSMLGLGFGLSKLGKKVEMLCPDKVPARYKTLPGAKRIKQHHHQPADLAISVDCGDIDQLSRIQDVFKKSKRIVEIDHHTYRTKFGDIQLVDTAVCSVGEIIFWILSELKIPLDKRIAECLLTSTLVETSSFSRHDVNMTTFEICSKIMRVGINFRRISDRYYWQKKPSAVQLSGLCLSRVSFKAKNQLAWSIIYQKDFEQFKGSKEDVDAVPDEMMFIENVKVSLLFREIENNMLRVSLRSKGDIDVGRLATSYGGGGHPDVAGCRIHNNKKTIEKFVNQACQLINGKI